MPNLMYLISYVSNPRIRFGSWRVNGDAYCPEEEMQTRKQFQQSGGGGAGRKGSQVVGQVRCLLAEALVGRRRSEASGKRICIHEQGVEIQVGSTLVSLW